MLGREVVGERPTEEELNRILGKFPHSVHAIGKIKVFRISNEY